MSTKKTGLGKGMAALMPASAERKEQPVELDEQQIVGNAVGQVAMIINESLDGIDDYHAERMCRMIISLCRAEMKNGYPG